MTAKKPKKAVEPTESVVYCGPTIPGVAKQYTVYMAGVVSPMLATAAEISPTIQGLIVPLDQLPIAMRQMREQSGSIYTLYRRADQGKN